MWNNKRTYRGGHAWSSHYLYLQESCFMCASPRAEELSATQWWDSVELHGSVGVVGADRSNESKLDEVKSNGHSVTHT